MRKIKVLAGSSHPELADLILDRLSLPPIACTVKRHPNQETAVEIGVSVRDQDVFIVQSGSNSINDHLMELLIMINACKIASARRITAVLPYFPYTKQSKKKMARGAITAKLVANMLAVSGVHHVITLDLHSSQIQGFFQRPVDNLLAEPTFAKFLKDKYPDEVMNAVIVSKNAGGVKRVTSLADRLKIDFALINRERHHHQPSATQLPESDPGSPSHVAPRAGTQVIYALTGGSAVSPTTADHKSPLVSPAKDKGPELVATFNNNVSTIGQERLTLVGDVTDRPVFLVDDILDGTGTFLDAAQHLIKCGAKWVHILATHGILSGNALREIQESPYVERVIVTNSYPISAEKKAMTNKLMVIDISGVLAEAIRRTHNGESISYLFHTAI